MQEQGKRPCQSRDLVVLGAEPRFQFELVMIRGMVRVRLVGFGPWFFYLHDVLRAEVFVINLQPLGNL